MLTYYVGLAALFIIWWVTESKSLGELQDCDLIVPYSRAHYLICWAALLVPVLDVIAAFYFCILVIWLQDWPKVQFWLKGRM